MKIRCCVLPAYDRTAPLADSPSATSLPPPWPRSLVADPFPMFRLDAPVLRQDLDAIRERRRIRFERAGDRDRLYKIPSGSDKSDGVRVGAGLQAILLNVR